MRGPLDPAVSGALAASCPDVEHVFRLPRPGGHKLFPSHRFRGWHRSGGLEAPKVVAEAYGHITAEHNAAFERALTGAGVEYELVTYEGAPHSFFDRKQAEHAEASEDAWRRVLGFLERSASLDPK